MAISNFIQQNYSVIFRGDGVKDLNDVEEVFLTEDHNTVGCQVINSRLIQLFARASDLVLIESIPSMQRAELNCSPSAAWLKTSAVICGWDVPEVLSKIAGPRTAPSLLDTATRVQVRVETLLRELSERVGKEREAIFPKLREALEENHEICKQLEAVGADSMERVEGTFPERQDSLVKSLMAAQGQGSRRFLIAGEAHLDSRVSLSVFERDYTGSVRGFLKSRNVVILSPTEETVERSGRELTEIMHRLSPKESSSGPYS